MHGKDERYKILETQKGGVHLKDLGVDNIEIEQKETGSNGLALIDLAQDRDVMDS